MSNYEVAAHCGVAEVTIRRARESHCDNDVVRTKTYTTKHSTRATMNTANIGKRTVPEPQVLVVVEAPAPEPEPEPQVLELLSAPDTPISLLEEALNNPGFPMEYRDNALLR